MKYKIWQIAHLVCKDRKWIFEYLNERRDWSEKALVLPNGKIKLLTEETSNYPFHCLDGEDKYFKIETIDDNK